MTPVQGSFLDKAMELCNSMMQFTGCELYSHNTRQLLLGLKACVNSNEDSNNGPIADTKISCINLLIDTLLEEEGIARAESLAYGDDEDYYEECWPYEDYDYPYPDEDEYYGPNPMYSAEDAFAQLELDDEEAEYDKENYLRGNTIEDMAEMEERHDNDDEIEAWANTPHDDMNLDLKDALETLENIKISKAIWSAREHMMSKIVFGNDDAYPIHHISFDVDEHGIPVDICITTRWQYLDYIAVNHGLLGYACGDDEKHGFYEGLFGRLDSFRVFDYQGNLLWQYDPKATRTYRF